jgi:hypothetical protein
MSNANFELDPLVYDTVVQLKGTKTSSRHSQGFKAVPFDKAFGEPDFPDLL